MDYNKNTTISASLNMNTLTTIDAQVLKELTNVGIALSAEKDHVRLLELILIKAKALTNADGGTLYSCHDDKLSFEIMLNNLDLKPLELHQNGQPNLGMVATSAALCKHIININDAYDQTEFDFSGSHNFDRNNHYHSQSFLTVPMVNHLFEVIGVLQLINKMDRNTGKVIPFSLLDQQIVESLASQAAVAITKNSLIAAQKKLFDSFLQLIAGAIDEKSPYTAGHCRRVPVLTTMIANAISETTTGPLKDFSLNSEELYELEVAAWLHDCGKITTPEYVVDKATKLETIYDRIHEIDLRFEVLKREMQIKHLTEKLQTLTGEVALPNSEQIEQLNIWRDFIRECNQGSETVDAEKIAIIEQIANIPLLASTLLSTEEVECLKIKRGTLSIRERQIINNHVSVSIKMLESLPYPKNLQNVAAYAGAHHEKMDGTGYPKGLKGDEIPMQGRIIAIADIFEALTSSDRPYKKAINLPKALDILKQMKKDGHIDPDIYDVFINKKIYLQYADKYLEEF
jgi:HD-GYP domain-containing protein (c-di-GMP phosphodiesterase class II)